MDKNTLQQIYKDIDNQIDNYRILRDNYSSPMNQEESAIYIMYINKIDALIKFKMAIMKKYQRSKL